MTDIFREVEEDVRRERYEQLWKKYGDYVIAGAALIIIAVAGFQLWRVYETRQRAKASDEYMAAEQLYEAGQTSKAATAFANLEKSAPGGYATLAKLQEANSMAASGNKADALIIYRQIAAGSDAMLAAVARLHAAWAIVDSSPKSDVETLVAPLTDSTNPWRFMARETLAYADYRAGASSAALREYQALADDTNAPSQLRFRSDIMATFIKSGGGKNYGTVPQPPPPQNTTPSQQPQGPAGGPSK